MKHQRIHIVGGAGSGKTTLAQAYSKQHGIPFFEIDNLFWSDVGNRDKRPEDEREHLLQQVTNSERWIVEGVFYRWLSPSFEMADKIIVLNIPRWVRHYRIIKRAIALLISEPASSRTIISNLSEIVAFNHSYNEVHYAATLELLSRYAEKVVICNSNREAILELSM